jgi:ribosomal protein L7/L12
MMIKVYIVAGVALSFIVAIALNRQYTREKHSDALAAGKTDEDVRQLAREGKEMPAILLYRDIHQCGLKEAKGFVESIMGGQE